ncbi:MAG: serine/threonine-protein phosphatase [Bacteroidaceae bacterium]|nr:serine/threonine-protein phosphatase [Bacteroidaceae bacterium]
MDLKQELLKTEWPQATGYAESRQGGRSENQDSFGWADIPELGFLVTVCDGMGGGPGGKTASQLAVNEIIAGVKEADKQEEISNILIKAIRRANMAIINMGDQQPTLKGMGSTCTVLLINSQSATIAHVGDSRVYQFRGQGKIFRTFDHSMVFDLVKQKVITEEQARLSAQSNIITRALGIKPDLEVEVTERAYEKGDRFMLCTDGIHGSIEEKKLIKMATSRKEGQLCSLVDSIAMDIDNLGRVNGGGHDNLTLAIIETKTDSIKKDTMSKRFKQLLMAIGAICIISIVFNAFLTAKVAKLSDTINQSETGVLTQKMELLEHQNDSLVSIAKQTSENIEGFKKLLEEEGKQLQEDKDEADYEKAYEKLTKFVSTNFK